MGVAAGTMTGVEAEQEFDFDFLFEFKHSDETGGGGGFWRGGRGTSGGAGGGMLPGALSCAAPFWRGERDSSPLSLGRGEARGRASPGVRLLSPPRREAASGAAAAGREVVFRRTLSRRSCNTRTSLQGGAVLGRQPVPDNCETWGSIELLGAPRCCCLSASRLPPAGLSSETARR